MKQATVKGALAMSLSLLCAIMSQSAAAADTWSTSFKLSTSDVFCKVRIYPTSVLGKGTYQFGCDKVGPGIKGLEVNFVRDDVYTWKWSAAGGNKQSTRYNCADKQALPQAYMATNECAISPTIIYATLDNVYVGKKVLRTHTYTACRSGLPPLGIHYRFWQEGTVTFSVKEPYSGQVKIVTTPLLKSEGTSHYSKTPACGWPVY
ncbi:MAG: hypothetical protein V4673_13690 [Pseudomonadota bacterium]